MSVDQPANREMRSDPPIPRRIPIAPPATERNTASIRNWTRMSRSFAPTASRTALHPVPLPEKGPASRLRRVDAPPVDGRDDDPPDRAGVRAPDKPVLDGGEGGDDGVVTVLPLTRL